MRESLAKFAFVRRCLFDQYLTALALQLPFFEVCFARAGLMSPTPGRPCEDVGVRDAPLSKLDGDAADFLDRPADQERCFGRGRVFLSDGPVLAR